MNKVNKVKLEKRLKEVSVKGKVEEGERVKVPKVKVFKVKGIKLKR